MDSSPSLPPNAPAMSVPSARPPPPVTANPSSAAAAAPPADCHLRFLMVNGDSFRLTVAPLTSVQALKQRIIDNPPKELVNFLNDSTPPVTTWPSGVDEIRILHLGKFLEDHKTLKEYNFATGTENQTTVHISLRVPAHVTDDVKDKRNKKGNACCTIM